MNPELPKNPREELELRITALLLGELPAEEAAAVREAIAKDAELTKLHDDLKQTIVLVREASTMKEAAAPQAEALKLSEERRQKLLTSFKIPPLKEEHRKPKRAFQFKLLEAMVVIAVLGLLAAVSLPNFVKSRTTSQRNSIVNNLRQLDGAKQQWALEKGKSADAEPTFTDIQPYMGRGPGNLPSPVAGEKYVLGKVGESVSAEVAFADAKKSFGGVPPANGGGQSDRVRISVDGDLSYAENSNEKGKPSRGPVQVSRAASESLRFGYWSSKEAASPASSVKPISPPIPPMSVDVMTVGSPTPSVPQIVLPQSVADTEPLEGRTQVAGQHANDPEWIGVLNKPDASGEGDRVPVLGDLPTLGKFYRSKQAGSAGSQVNADHGIQPSSKGVVALGLDVPGLVAVEESIVNTSAPASVSAALIPSQKDSTSVLAYGIADKDSDKPVNVYDLNAVGYFAVPSSTNSMNPNDSGRTREGRAMILGKQLKEVELADSFSVQPRRQNPPAESKTRAYLDQKQKVEELKQFASALERKVHVEEISVALPKTAQVKIIDRATTNTASSKGIVGGLRRLLSSDSESTARVGINPDPDALVISGLSEDTRAPYYDPYFAEIESEVVKSDLVLSNVVNAYNLSEEWGKKYGTGKNMDNKDAVRLLRDKLEVSITKGSGIMDIRAKDKDPVEAARLANAVAAAYQDYRIADQRQLAIGGINALEKKLAEQNKAVEKAQEELTRLEKELKPADADLPNRKPVTNAAIPQPEIQTSENNFSTFSLNVSDVSFKLAAASLEKGQMPDAASVRSEEFINAFDYRDPEAKGGAPIAFAWERARYPFAHNRDLLRFSLKTAAAGRQAGRPLNIVLLLDNSGSMERADRVLIRREALRVLASQLQPQDKLSVITFARTARLVAGGVSGDKAGEVLDQVSSLTPEGGTNLEEAMNLAYQTAAKHYITSGINRVVLLTDGAANLGDVEPASLKQKVEAQRKQGIALDCFGIGWEGFNDDLLEVLSRNGDGRYGFLNSPEEAATDFAGQLAGALKVAASDVKVQVEFNPKRVTSYRQIGYAKHQLTKEQFRDNTVDAAEIAAQEAGNALFTVESNPAGEGPLATVRVRYKVPGTTDYREMSWDVPFTGNALALEHSSPAMRLAASASAFSEWLVASPFAGEVKPDALLGYLRGVPEVYGVDARPKKLEWMIRQAKSVAGQ